MNDFENPHRGFTTQEIALAAFLQTRGHEATLIPPDNPSGYFSFSFQGDIGHFERLAEDFASGGSVPAFRFYNALNALKGEIRLARGGWR